jgi:prepilin-type N-terminal cleavage/methylation domain-containing protein
MRNPSSRTARPPSGFSLVELLVVMAVIVVLLALVVPAITGIKGAGGVTKATYDVSGALETARAYALAHNTYTWVGFLEEDASGSSTPPVANPEKVVLAIVASKNGTTVYDPNSGSDPDPIDPAELTQIAKLAKIDGVRLASFPDGSGTGETFETRPPALLDEARIGGDQPPTSTQYPFQTAQYTFRKTIQFSPRGEATVNSTYSLRPVIEIGLQPAHGEEPGNVVAVQISGVTGNVTIYRP